MLKRFTKWAYNHENGSDPKYSTLVHSLFTTFKGTLIFVLTALAIRYYFFDRLAYPLQPAAPAVGVFLLTYLVVMIGSRFLQHGTTALYETLWACNQSILLAGIGCIVGDSFLIRSVLVLVSLDQISWYFIAYFRYIDLIGFIIKRKFYVGVAKYIIWPETTKIRLMTTFHHIWFLPLCLWIIHPTAKYTTFNTSTFILSCIYSSLLCVIGRLSAPKEITYKNEHSSQETTTVYMNLNLSWELWKDVKIGFV